MQGREGKIRKKNILDRGRAYVKAWRRDRGREPGVDVSGMTSQLFRILECRDVVENELRRPASPDP